MKDLNDYILSILRDSCDRFQNQEGDNKDGGSVKHCVHDTIDGTSLAEVVA